MKLITALSIGALLCSASIGAAAKNNFPIFPASPWCGCKGYNDLYTGKVYPPAQYPDFGSNQVKTTAAATNNELTWLLQLAKTAPDARQAFVQNNQQLVSYADMEFAQKAAAEHCNARASSNQSNDPSLKHIQTEKDYAYKLSLSANDCHDIPVLEKSIKDQEIDIINYCDSGIFDDRQCKTMKDKLANDKRKAPLMRENCAANFTELFREPPLLRKR